MYIIETISVDEDVTLISLNNSPADVKTVAALFSRIAEADVDVDMISQFPLSGTHSGLSFTVSDEAFGLILPIVTQLHCDNPEVKVSVSSGNCKISVFGQAMKGTPGVAAKVFAAAAGVNADLRMISTSETDISLLVVQADVHNTLRAIERAFSESQ